MNASTFAQLLLLWQRELHRLDSFLQLHLAFRQFPVQLHLGTPWPPPMLSSLAAVLRGTTLAMLTSSGFRNDVIVGENWFRLYTDSNIPVAQPNLQRTSISKIRTKLLSFWSCLRFTCTSRPQFSERPHTWVWQLTPSLVHMRDGKEDCCANLSLAISVSRLLHPPLCCLPSRATSLVVHGELLVAELTKILVRARWATTHTHCNAA